MNITKGLNIIGIRSFLLRWNRQSPFLFLVKSCKTCKAL